MPRLYKRKEGVQARIISWTTEQLQSAFEEIDKNKLGINEISRRFKIPPRTLRRRFATRNKSKLTQGKHPVLGFENERKLVALILKLCDAGFPSNRLSVRTLAYHFAEKMQIKHSFDKKQQMAGHQWLKSFIERNSHLLKETRCLFEDTDKSMNSTKESREDLKKKEFKKSHELLIKVLSDNNLRDKPERIYNMDETSVQFNNKSANNVADASAKETSEESDATLTIVACCNVIGNFLPPVIIMEGMNKQAEFLTCLPLGSKVYMNKNSAYINTDLFFKWFTEHFIDLKPRGKVLLILDEHLSHSSAPDMLRIASDNDIILLCLPTNSALPFQPIDIAVLKPLETFFNHETNEFMSKNPNEKLSPYHAGIFIHNAWMHVATPKNAIEGFRRSEIYPFYPFKHNTLSDSTSNIHSSYDNYEQSLEELDTKPAFPYVPSANENIEPYVHVKIEPTAEDPLLTDFIPKTETQDDIVSIQQRDTYSCHLQQIQHCSTTY